MPSNCWRCSKCDKVGMFTVLVEARSNAEVDCGVSSLVKLEITELTRASWWSGIHLKTKQSSLSLLTAMNIYLNY